MPFKLPNLAVRRPLARLRYGGQARCERRRQTLAWRWLRGSGLELGALHRPLRLPTSASASYVDHLDAAALRRHYPELAADSLVPVDIVDDAERLLKVPAASQDFVIASHVLEHCENPIGALQNWLRVLRPGAIAYLAVPDKRFTFDRARPVTTWDHLLEDWRKGPEVSRRGHYQEWVELVVGTPPEMIEDRVREFLDARYSIHFHVWTSRALSDFFGRCAAEAGLTFGIRELVRNGFETLVILQRPGARPQR